jgi:DNA-binding NarL/FixJ family response regulator
VNQKQPGGVIIADRHPICRAGLRTLLAEAWPDCSFYETETFDELLESIGRNGGLDLILLDPVLPGLPGFGGLSQLRRAAPAARLVVISDSDRRDTVQATFASGAVGFIPKTVSLGVLIGALEVVMADGVYVPESLALQSPRNKSESPRATLAPEDADEPPILTPRQREVLRLLVLGLRNKEIARQLGLATGTVKVHVGSVLKTLNARNRTHAVALARRLGLVEGTQQGELHAA